MTARTGRRAEVQDQAPDVEQLAGEQLPPDDRPEIAVPEKPGAPFGQFSFDVPGLAFNFMEYDGSAWRGQASLDAEELRLAEYLAGLEARARSHRRGFPFRAPHDGLIHYLEPHGARHVVAVCHGRDMSGDVAPRSDAVRLVRMRPDMLPPGLVIPS